jgi:hypothetical protein
MMNSVIVEYRKKNETSGGVDGVIMNFPEQGHKWWELIFVNIRATLII